MRTLEECRADIDAVDSEIAAALSRRFALTDEVSAIKQAAGIPAVDSAREAEIVRRMLAATPVAHRDTVYSIYERIFGGARGMIETIARGICIQDGKVLLCRAKGGASTYLPGGHIEFGETGAEALVREVKEELGVGSVAGELVGVVENSFLQHGKPHAEINLVYRLSLDERQAEIVSQEDWISFEWCPLDRLAAAKLLPERMQKLCSM